MNQGNGPVVVVTGASAGVGRAIAIRFADAGFRLGLIARDATALEDLREECARRGAQALPIAADVADAPAMFAAAECIEAELGPIRIWINDAMETVFSRFGEMTPEEFRRVTEVTYLGFVHGTMAALRRMRVRDRGTIIQIGSALAYRGIPLQSAYCGAKHAIRGFTESVRSELIHDRSAVRLVMVDLPAVNTPQFGWARAHLENAPRPMGAPTQPELVAEAVFRAAHGNRSDYWIGWTTALTVLGNAILPGFMDRYLARAVEGQQGDEPISPDRRDNLQAPVPGRHRTEGSFSAEATAGAPLMAANVVRIGVVAAGALLFAGVGAAIAAARRRR
ncbi:SDR family oxidoreductase [Hansschlegelia beijingensis]|uniref:SDR family oxidoreductase n=1 Tax=Hansschlegelia beijingensis TaxID=1133344 RepID=UPI00387F28B4